MALDRCKMGLILERYPMPDPDPGLATSLLVDHLRTRSANGQTRVYLTPEAQANLAGASRAKPPRELTPALVEKDPAEPVEPSLSPGDKAARLKAIRDRAEKCPECTGLETLRDTFVFAVGNHDANIVFVGEAPGYDEEKQQEPFVGKAGQLLDKIIKAMGIGRDDVYISNIVKWRPKIGDGNQGTRNRKPSEEEMGASKAYVLEEIKVVQPRAIIALGGTAALGLLGLEIPVSRARGQFFDLDGIPAIVTYHPSYLLRNEAPSERRKVWEDILMVMERTGMPVSEKQRGFFKPKA